MWRRGVASCPAFRSVDPTTQWASRRSVHLISWHQVIIVRYEDMLLPPGLTGGSVHGPRRRDVEAWRSHAFATASYGDCPKHLLRTFYADQPST